MATATAKKPAKQKAVTFETDRPNFRVVVEPAIPALRDANQRVIEREHPGKHAQFNGFTFTTDDPEVIEYLRAGIERYQDPAQNVRPADEFATHIWEQGKHPGEPKPTVSEQMKAITTAAVKRDRLVIEMVIEAEKGSHNRQEVILAAEAALDELGEE